MGYHNIFLSDRLEDLIKAGNLQVDDLVPKLLEDYFKKEREPVSLPEISTADESEKAARRASREERKIRAEVRESELAERRAQQEKDWEAKVSKYEKRGPETEQGRSIIEAVKDTEEHIRRLEQTQKMMERVTEETEQIVRRIEQATKKSEGTVKDTEKTTKETEKTTEETEKTTGEMGKEQEKTPEQ